MRFHKSPNLHSQSAWEHSLQRTRLAKHSKWTFSVWIHGCPQMKCSDWSISWSGHCINLFLVYHINVPDPDYPCFHKLDALNSFFWKFSALKIILQKNSNRRKIPKSFSLNYHFDVKLKSVSNTNMSLTLFAFAHSTHWNCFQTWNENRFWAEIFCFSLQVCQTWWMFPCRPFSPHSFWLQQFCLQLCASF